MKELDFLEKIDKIKTAKWVLFLLVLAFIIFFFSKLFGAVSRWFTGEDEASGGVEVTDDFISKLPDVPPVEGPAAKAGFDTSPFISELDRVLTMTAPTFFQAQPRCAIAERVNALNDNEIIDVYNDYKNAYSRSLKKDLQGLTYDGCTVFQTNHVDKLIARLNKLRVV